MVQHRLQITCAIAALALTLHPVSAMAQQSSSEWFVPGQQRTPAPPAQRPIGRAPTMTQPPAMIQEPVGPEDQGQVPPQLQVQLPPAPEVPTLPKGATPPAAIVGILSVPDVLRVSSAYQQADKELGSRRQKLNEDAQKEQVAIRDLGQALANERSKLSPEQIRNRERELQDRIAEARRKFAERNRIIQEAGQYIMAQIDRTLEQVAQQVAISRGVNLVLNRAQILGTTADFDLTPQVAEVMNKVMVSVVVPPDGVSPVAMAGPPTAPGGAPGGAAPSSALPTPPAQPAAAKTPPKK